MSSVLEILKNIQMKSQMKWHSRKKQTQSQAWLATKSKSKSKKNEIDRTNE